MKSYPSIPSISDCNYLIGSYCISFEKYDGSNLRFLYSNKKGWNLFGTRTRLFDKSDPDFGCAIDIYLDKYGSKIEDIIKKDKIFKNARELIFIVNFLVIIVLLDTIILLIQKV